MTGYACGGRSPIPAGRLTYAGSCTHSEMCYVHSDNRRDCAEGLCTEIDTLHAVRCWEGQTCCGWISMRCWLRSLPARFAREYSTSLSRSRLHTYVSNRSLPARHASTPCTCSQRLCSHCTRPVASDFGHGNRTMREDSQATGNPCACGS